MKTSLCCIASAILLSLSLVTPAPAQDSPANASDAPKLLHSTNAKPTSRMITLSDFGAEDLAYLAVPATPPSLGIVLVPDAYGLDNYTKSEADYLASLGYLVVAVDIYNGHTTTYPGELANLIANLNAAPIMKTITAGIRLFHESPKFHADHVVVLGWGAGATYVFQSARESKNIDGAVTFYGPVETQPDQIGKFNAPLCAIYPENDPITTHEKVLIFQQLMKDAGNTCEAWFIAAAHGWSNPSSKAYNAAEDKEAWKVALPFLIRIAAEPVKAKDASIVDKAKDTMEKAKTNIENFFK